MKILEIKALAIPDVKVIRYGYFMDHRGYFTEPFRKSDIMNAVEAGSFRGREIVQMNESRSAANVCRGLHFQWNPFMGKLVRTLAGHMVDLVMDIRKGSPWFGKIIAYDMPQTPDQEFGEWIWVPPGFAHGNFFPEPTSIEYCCTGEYSPGNEAGVSPLAEDLDWSLCDPTLKARFDALKQGDIILSDKDRDGLSLAAWDADERSANFVFGQC